MSRSPAVVLGGYAAFAMTLSSVAPALAPVLLEITVLALLGLSLDVVLRRLGMPVLLQPGAVAAGAWATAALLGRNQSPVIALAAAALLGAGVAVLAIVGVARGPAGLAAAGLAVAVAATTVAPAAPGFTPPVFLGVGLGGTRAALGAALLALVAGAWLHRQASEGDLGRWLAIARETPGLVARVGLSLRGVVGGGLAVSGLLAGLAGWAATLGTLGVPAVRAIDPAVGLAWLLVPLAGGAGLSGALTGAAVFAGVARLASAAGVPALALAGPLVVVLLWRESAR